MTCAKNNYRIPGIRNHDFANWLSHFMTHQFYSLCSLCTQHYTASQPRRRHEIISFRLYSCAVFFTCSQSESQSFFPIVLNSVLQGTLQDVTHSFTLARKLIVELSGWYRGSRSTVCLALSSILHTEDLIYRDLSFFIALQRPGFSMSFLNGISSWSQFLTWEVCSPSHLGVGHCQVPQWSSVLNSEQVLSSSYHFILWYHNPEDDFNLHHHEDHKSCFRFLCYPFSYNCIGLYDSNHCCLVIFPHEYSLWKKVTVFPTWMIIRHCPFDKCRKRLHHHCKICDEHDTMKCHLKQQFY
jgi:hypothetical protein